MAFQIDTGTEFGQRVARRLESELIGWLTTVSPAGVPVPSPIWFLWDGESFLIYSQPDVPKLRNIAANPNVSLHLDGDGDGGDIVIVTGTAAVSQDPPAHEVPPYIAKYAQQNRALLVDERAVCRRLPGAVAGHAGAPARSLTSARC